MTIFLAFALSYPDTTIMLYFIIPIKMKWMAIVYGVLIAWSFYGSGMSTRVCILAAIVNFAIFHLTNRRFYHVSPKQVKRRHDYQRQVRQPTNISKHKCAICGRTELDGDDIQFRFCSKCNGNYEYCQDHLFTHEHIV